jgi:hypothetical protein
METSCDIPVIPGFIFIWKDNVGITEASSIACMSPDWCAPMKLTVQSHRTGRTKDFLYENTEVNDGEIAAWIYKSADEQGTRLHIFND